MVENKKMDLLDIALEEGEQEQAAEGEAAEEISQMNRTAVEFANEGKPDEQKEPIPELYQYPGSGTSVPTGSVKYFRLGDATIKNLKKLLPNISSK